MRTNVRAKMARKKVVTSITNTPVRVMIGSSNPARIGASTAGPDSTNDIIPLARL